MSTKLDLSVPATNPARSQTSRLVGILLILVLALQAALLLHALRRPSAQATGSGTGLASEPSRALALKLEKQGLNEAASAAWETYLGATATEPEKAARIWYRIGSLRQEAGQFEQALAAFYRSEAHAESKDISADLGRRVQECLEALGKFAALRYELAERVGIKPEAKDTGDVTLAEIGPRKITKAELDRRIEGFVERQLAQMAGGMPPAQLNKQKEALIARLGNASERQRFLQQFLSEQILYLKAREDKLPENPEVRAQLLDAERSILANETMRRALTERIQITPSDVQTFYDASKAQFMTPAQAKIRHILLPDEEQAKAALNSLTAGKDFAELAKTASKDKGTADQGGELPGLQAGTPTVPGIGQAPELAKAVFAGEVGKVLPIPYKTAQGWHVVKIDERQPEKQRTFEEAREEAYSRLLSRKQQEVQKTLFEELRTRYDVVVHRDQLAPAKPEAGPGK